MTSLSRLTRDGSHEVVVIGLDGATWDLVGPLMAQGVMPNLKSIVESGCHGRLFSSIPPVTAPAWSTFFTGKNPGKHGLYDFWGPLRSGFSRRLNDSSTIRANALWDILGEHNKTVGMINVPMTYPIREVNGYAIAGMLTARRDETFAQPAELIPEVGGEADYIIDVEPSTYIESGDIEGLLKSLVEMTDKRIALAEKMIDRYPVDLFMLVFVTPDRMQHTLWHIMDTTHPLHDKEEARRYLPLIHACYAKVDEGIGRLVRQAGPSAATIVMSDHGFGPLTTHVDIEAFLRKSSFLSYRRGMRMARRALETVHAETLAWKILGMRRRGKMAPLGLARIKEFMVDWERTLAYRGDAAGYSLYLNVRGREPFGRINPGEEYESVRRDILASLERLVDPKTKQPIVESACRSEDVYDGPYVCDSPDILLTMKSGYKAGRPYYSSRVFWPAKRDRWGTGCHRVDGIMAISGPDIAANDQRMDARIMDVAPTILYLLGLPVPSDMDGQVLSQCISPTLLAGRPVEIGQGAERASDEQASAYSAEDEQILSERLRNLGYVD